MSYEKEIILFKKHEFTALELLNCLKDSSWKPTLSVIGRGEDFDWVDAKDQAEFEEILKDKTDLKEYMGFTVKHQQNGRFVTINMDEQHIIFNLDIERSENELEWFAWYFEELVLNVSTLKEKVDKVEWRSGYDHELLKTITKQDFTEFFG